MSGVSKHMAALTTLCAALLAASCLSDRGPAKRAVICAGCESVWIPAGAGLSDEDDVFVYRVAGGMDCPSCQSAVSNLLTTGVLRHSCSICEAEMIVCELSGE